jgi:hypothetical protein
MIRWPGTSLYDKKPQYGLHSGKTDATFGSQNRINQQSHMRLCWLMRNYLLSNTLEVGITRDNSLICLSFKHRMQSRCYEPFGINQQSHMK